MIRLAFFDVDGTLSAPRYYIDGVMQIGGTARTWIDYCRVHGDDSYEYCYGVKPVREHAEELKKEGVRLFVLSSVMSDYEGPAKTKFVKRVYPDLFEDFFYVHEDDQKLTVIREIAAGEGVSLSECELVEDTLNTLFKAASIGIVPMHVSMLVQEDKTE